MKNKLRPIIVLVTIALTAFTLIACSDQDRMVDPDLIFSNKYKKELTVHFFHLDLLEKSGESILIEAPNGKTVLIDAGIPEAGEIVDEYLEKLKIEKIDYVMPSHPHIDHIGGYHTIFETKEVGKVYEINIPHDTGTYEKYKRLMNEKEIPYEIIEAGDVIELDDDIYLEVFNPPVGTSKESLEADYSQLGARHINNVSAVMKLVHGENSFLFTGDIYQEREMELVEEYGELLEATVLVAPHHGDSTSSAMEFIETVNPEISIIPSNILFNQIVYDRYEVNQESEVFHSFYDGNILLRSDGEKIKVITEKEREE